jgi:hypothetical protein
MTEARILCDYFVTIFQDDVVAEGVKSNRCGAATQEAVRYLERAASLDPAQLHARTSLTEARSAAQFTNLPFVGSALLARMLLI